MLRHFLSFALFITAFALGGCPSSGADVTTQFDASALGAPASDVAIVPAFEPASLVPSAAASKVYALPLDATFDPAALNYNAERFESKLFTFWQSLLLGSQDATGAGAGPWDPSNASTWVTENAWHITGSANDVVLTETADLLEGEWVLITIHCDGYHEGASPGSDGWISAGEGGADVGPRLRVSNLRDAKTITLPYQVGSAGLYSFELRAHARGAKVIFAAPASLLVTRLGVGAKP